MSSTQFTTYDLPNLGRQAHFYPRSVMERRRPRRAEFHTPFQATIALPPVQLPVDWSQDGKVSYPMDGNDQKGDCMYAAACHVDNTWTANTGQESTFDLQALLQHYRRLSGGDNGLDESQITQEWASGLCGDANATILDSLDIDCTDTKLCQSAVYLFGAVFFMLSVPNKWIQNADTGAVWDAPARPNPMNGHGVCWVGYDAQGRVRLITWGTYVWLTPAGVQSCDPSGFILFTKRWFDPRTGFAPNGLHYDQLAEIWHACGGKQQPAGVFPSPLPPNP